MAITSSHAAFSRAFDAEPLAWKNPIAKMQTHTYGVISFDEALDNKRYSYQDMISLVSESEKITTSGKRSINCVYVNPIAETCWIYDYREINQDETAAVKVDHIQKILLELADDLTTPFSTVLLKNWYAIESVMLLVAKLGKAYWCPLRGNRLASEASEGKRYTGVKDLKFSDLELMHGKLVNLKSFPKDHQVKLFRMIKENGTIAHVVTNQLHQDCVDTDQFVGGVYWKAEHVFL